MRRWYSIFLPHSTIAIVWLAILLVFAFSILARVGKVFDIPLLESIKPHWVKMRVLTAVCLILAAMQLAILPSNPSLFRRVKVLQVPATLVGLAGLLTTVLYAIALITRQEPSLERIQVLNLLWSQANRMALLAAIFFLLNGCALSLLSSGGRRATNIAHILMIPGVLIGYAGYVEDGERNLSQRFL